MRTVICFQDKRMKSSGLAKSKTLETRKCDNRLCPRGIFERDNLGDNRKSGIGNHREGKKPDMGFN